MGALRRIGVAALLGLAAAFAPITPEHDANASVSVAVIFDDLVQYADAVAVATPVEENTVWENGRIYTYTRVHVDTGIAGELGTGSQAWVRTMGGIVGHIGQSVEGEAVFTVGRPSIVFLRHGVPGSFEVTGRAQGQYPVYLDDATKQLRVMRSSAVGALFPPKAKPSTTEEKLNPQSVQTAPPILARDVLHLKPVDQASRLIAEAFKRLHASK
jgi:hypothetical protein